MGDHTTQPGAPAEVLPHLQDAPAGATPVSLQYPNPSASAGPPAQGHQEQPAGSQHAFAAQLDMTHQQRTAPFDMSAMTNALPQQPYRAHFHGHNHDAPRYSTATMLSPGTPTQMHAAQFGAPSLVGTVTAQQYYVPQHARMAQFYPAPMSPQQPSSLPPRTDLGYYPSPVVVNQPPHAALQFYYTPAATVQGQTIHAQGHLALGQYGLPNFQQHPDARSRQPQRGSQGASPAAPSIQQGNASPTSGRHSLVRGPPRKPRQSGHAVWIGNLPPQTDLMSLVHHVCKETTGLESLFLISKSNCAFANFKDEQSCSAAQRKLHDSKFSTVRLVCRLRKSTVEGPAGVTAPTGPAASASQPGATQEGNGYGGDEPEHEEDAVEAPTPAASNPETRATSAPAGGAPQQKDRFFILKSLTVEDLELSVQTNVWATQSHNEETLNSAFKTSDNVYLVFSANKSGEYFGYARMMSPINEDPAAAIEFAPSAQSASEVDLPKAIPTEPTEFAPRGRIIDDSARGTIFWEADRDEKGADGGGQDDDGPGGGSVTGDTGSVRSSQDGGGGTEPKAWGKPFRLEWLSTARLPFYRTRGLRNPWNSNREVKIARDGTELEPSVGRRLIGLFNRAQSPALAMAPNLVPPMAAAMGAKMPAVVTVGYPPMP
ncbi:zinc finger CCCH domain-containing protein 45 [Achaetomium macrosporum]|uniref:Zinc finger CCCH domain-containing protein 45 n=1 Tax=Achaetomium macrosporum TaxID=79813 RepID=A0AAN7CCD4_9PEZI|nr:zinc finger CCCH domain-containing protein 45 [Achaetomium macrosporum]